jgi:4-amino-4-deoxy-L-arabinose transferase-like glycosyltransferase
MRSPRLWRWIDSSDVRVLALFGLGIAVLHIAVNGQYGFHRDELLTFTNARDLAWGYVSYPPMTAFLARVELEMFGTSLVGFRFFAALSHGIVLVLAGLIARQLGGKRWAQLLAAASVAVGGHALWSGGSHSYTTFDYLWWVLAAYFVSRLLSSGNPRWWVAIGAAIGLGMLTKYTMAFLVLGVVVGTLLTPARRHLRSGWFWLGVAAALLVIVPNVVWLFQHQFASIECMRSIHERDIRWGRTDNFLIGQFWKCANPLVTPVWCAGLWHLFATRSAKRFRMLGWMYVTPLLALLLLRGRDYYMASAYPMLLAAGAVWAEQWLNSLSASAAAMARSITWRALLIAGLSTAALTVPIAPLGSAWWRVADTVNGNFNMEIGWPELAETVAAIRTALPAEEQARLGILAGDEGETGAINLYGPQYGLPQAISGMNSNWMRGYGDPPPQTVITLGLKRDVLDPVFGSCTWAGRLTNRYGIENATIDGYDDVFVCRNIRQPWPDFWKHFRYYG